MICHLSLKGNFLTALNGQDLRELFNGQAQNMPNSHIFFSLKFTVESDCCAKGISFHLTWQFIIADIEG